MEGSCCCSLPACLLSRLLHARAGAGTPHRQHGVLGAGDSWAMHPCNMPHGLACPPCCCRWLMSTTQSCPSATVRRARRRCSAPSRATGNPALPVAHTTCIPPLMDPRPRHCMLPTLSPPPACIALLPSRHRDRWALPRNGGHAAGAAVDGTAGGGMSSPAPCGGPAFAAQPAGVQLSGPKRMMPLLLPEHCCLLLH